MYFTIAQIQIQVKPKCWYESLGKTSSQCKAHLPQPRVEWLLSLLMITVIGMNCLRYSARLPTAYCYVLPAVFVICHRGKAVLVQLLDTQ